MKRVKATISYDGSKFCGFQRQEGDFCGVANSLEKILNSLNIDSNIVASGRTDSGVHALGQVIHFDIPSYWSDLKKLKYYINRLSYPYIKIMSLKIVDSNFHARFSAKRRVYRYVISTKDLPIFFSNYVLEFQNILDENSIKESIKLFKGEHDFKYFKKNGSDERSTVRKIYNSYFYRYKDFYIFSFEANGYLRSQIRMMVYFLLQIGMHKLTKNDLKKQLNLEDRFSSELVKPNGLYLCRIKY